MLSNSHARRTLALMTSARALHRAMSPADVAGEAGVTRSDVVNAIANAGVSVSASKKLFAWNDLALDDVIRADPDKPEPDVARRTGATPLISDFKSIFCGGFRP